MPKAKTGISQRVWLFLLEHGGHWTTAELAEQMGSGAAYMDKIIWSMHKCGSVSKYRSSQRKNGSAFGVSIRNMIPHGLSLSAILKATGIRKSIETGEPAANDGRAKVTA